MGWQYSISSGEISHDGAFEGTGYSGRAGPSRNNPLYSPVSNYGPIPPGTWLIGKSYHDPERGPCVMPLTPAPETETYGRSGFLIHGDNVNHDASSGCIILGPAIREKISTSGDDELEVIA